MSAASEVCHNVLPTRPIYKPGRSKFPISPMMYDDAGSFESQAWLHYRYTGHAAGLWRMHRHGHGLFSYSAVYRLCSLSESQICMIEAHGWLDRLPDLTCGLWLTWLHWVAKFGDQGRCVAKMTPEHLTTRSYMLQSKKKQTERNLPFIHGTSV